VSRHREQRQGFYNELTCTCLGDSHAPHCFLSLLMFDAGPRPQRGRAAINFRSNELTEITR
jgi:hypothetical protein